MMEEDLNFTKTTTTAAKIAALHKHWERLREQREKEFANEQENIKKEVNSRIHQKLNSIVRSFYLVENTSS